MPAFLIAAPASGSGKTTLTLGLIRAATKAGYKLVSGKSGPDYIDPRFHEAAGAPCVNLDSWAMTEARLQALACAPKDHTLVIEGAMGLFDGAGQAGRGSSAALAKTLNIPVVLNVDCARMSGSVAPLVRGFRDHDPAVNVAGVILNKTGSPRHEALLRAALEPLDIKIFGAVPRDKSLALPSRHLGLTQASEHPDLDAFLDHAAQVVSDHLDLAALMELGPDPSAIGTTSPTTRLVPPAQRIAIARDEAFAFSYPHMLRDWRDAGASLNFFSPLRDDKVPDADFVFLPGGYPELHAARLSQNSNFMNSLRNAAQTSEIYGECGGYMTLGETLTDADGTPHPMAGLLPLHSSFAKPRLHLGYRELRAQTPLFGGTGFAAHEFHYATTEHANGPALFNEVQDADGQPLAPMGLRAGPISGSFAHIIDRIYL